VTASACGEGGRSSVGFLRNEDAVNESLKADVRRARGGNALEEGVRAVGGAVVKEEEKKRRGAGGGELAEEVEK